MTDHGDAITMWLAVLALAAAGQFLLGLAAMFFAVGAYRRSAAAIEALDQDHVRPLISKTNAFIDDVQDVTARFRATDQSVRASLQNVETTLRTTGAAVRERFWPLVGAVRAIGAGLDVLTRSKGSSGVRVP
jgi:hypothetical protein